MAGRDTGARRTERDVPAGIAVDVEFAAVGGHGSVAVGGVDGDDDGSSGCRDGGAINVDVGQSNSAASVVHDGEIAQLFLNGGGDESGLVQFGELVWMA